MATRNRGGDVNQIYISGLDITPGQPIRTGLTEINNTIVGGGESLVYSFAPSVIANNVFFNTAPPASYDDPSHAGLACLDPEASNSQIDIHNNDIFNAGSPVDGQCKLGANNLSVDPQLRNIGAGDFHDQLGSPLVAAGDISAPLIPPADLDNKARTVCNTIDIGAYELRPHPPISVTSSANPTPGGGTITFTARLTGNCNVPTGIVTFLDGSNIIGTGAIAHDGTATFSTAFLVVGQHNITASYPGDFNFEDSTSPVLVQTITGDPTATTISVSPNPAGAFSPIFLSAVVSSQYGTPTGSVVFSAMGKPLATAPLDANGRASATVTSLGAGTYPITANYTADTRFQPSSSSAIQELVVSANSTMTLASSANPAFAGQSVSFAATVRAAQGAAVPTGTVTFADGGITIGTVMLVNGVAVFSTAQLGLGTHAIGARYNGSSNFGVSNASLIEVIRLIGTSTQLTASPNPANANQNVTLTASVTPLVSGALPRGTVTFLDGATQLGIAAIGANESATLTTSALGVGSHALSAVFSGSSLFGGSASPAVNEVIQTYDFTLALSKPTVSIPSEDWTRVTVTVTPVGGFKGKVTLSCANLPQHAQCGFDGGPTVSLSNGPKQVSMIVNTSELYLFGHQVSGSSSGSSASKAIAVSLIFPVLSCLWGFQKKTRLRGSLLVLLAMILFAGLQGCTSRLPAGAAPGSYTVSVVGTSDDAVPIRHSDTLALVVTAKP